jgi:hypothetical protein
MVAAFIAETETAVEVVAVVPLPSRPFSLFPQHRMDPSLSTAHDHSRPWPRAMLVTTVPDPLITIRRRVKNLRKI